MEAIQRRRLATVVVTVGLIAAPPVDGQTARAARLSLKAPQSLVVPLHGGKGSVVAWLGWRGTGPPPKLEITDALGPAHVIPRSAITVTAAGAPVKAGNDILFAVAIVVDGVQGPVGAEYQAYLVAAGADPISVRITDATTASVSVSPESVQFQWLVLETGITQLHVTNTGNVSIVGLTASLSARSAAGRQLEESNVIGHGATPAPIEPGHETTISLRMPVPRLAGTYTGLLRLRYNDTKSLKVPVSISARGPAFGSQRLLVLPAALFGLALVLGFWLSQMLENWFVLGGLRRAETAIALSALATELRRLHDRLVQLGPMPRTERRVDYLRQVAEEIRAGARQVADAGAEAARMAVAAEAARWAISALEFIAQHIPAELPAVRTTIDALPLPVDADGLAQYRQAVDAAITPQANRLATMGVAVGPAFPEPLPFEDAATLNRRIARMIWLQTSLVWLISGIAAYQTFYVDDPAFGSAMDYLVVFVWAIGLSQAGTQILTRARWSAKVP